MKYLLRFLLFTFCLAILALAAFILRANQQLRPILSDETPPINQQRKAKVLSAFFGLDNALPLRAIGLSWKAPGKKTVCLLSFHMK